MREPMTLSELSDWARGSLRDEIGVEAAAAYEAAATDLLLYGATRPETAALLAALSPRDLVRVMWYLDA